jgi:hypothetical protein
MGKTITTSRSVTIPTHGGGDPEGFNAHRVQRGIDILAIYDDPEASLSDALADLLHAAHDQGLDFADELRKACTHFREETAPDA